MALERQCSCAPCAMQHPVWRRGDASAPGVSGLVVLHTLPVCSSQPRSPKNWGPTWPSCGSCSWGCPRCGNKWAPHRCQTSWRPGRPSQYPAAMTKKQRRITEEEVRQLSQEELVPSLPSGWALRVQSAHCTTSSCWEQSLVPAQTHRIRSYILISFPTDSSA